MNIEKFTQNAQGAVVDCQNIAISMGCNVSCPFIGRGFDDNWGLQDPTGQSDEVFVDIIRQIEEKQRTYTEEI